MNITMIIDTMWVLIAGILVFFMNLGFAAVEAGFARAKNTVNILSTNFIVFAVSSLGFMDFAGDTVVHSVGGWAGLAGAIVLGPRIGKYGKNGKANAIPGHSMSLAVIGLFVLWLGWFGFNQGSTMSFQNP